MCRTHPNYITTYKKEKMVFKRVLLKGYTNRSMGQSRDFINRPMQMYLSDF